MTKENLPRMRGRPVTREQQHVQRSDAREAPHYPVHGNTTRVRRRKMSTQEDMFYIPLDEIPEGSSYEWKRYTLVGEEQPFYLASLREQGWEPVSPKRHPSWVPADYTSPYIIKGGQILMERPIELTLEAREEERAAARMQVRITEQRVSGTPDNTFTRDHSAVRPRFEKEYVRAVVEE